MLSWLGFEKGTLWSYSVVESITHFNKTSSYDLTAMEVWKQIIFLRNLNSSPNALVIWCPLFNKVFMSVWLKNILNLFQPLSRNLFQSNCETINIKLFSCLSSLDFVPSGPFHGDTFMGYLDFKKGKAMSGRLRLSKRFPMFDGKLAYQINVSITKTYYLF